MTDTFMRRALWASVPFNAFGALLFLFPEALGRYAGLPAPVPHVYSATIAVLVALFGGTYAWLARQAEINRPLVVFCTLGKAGFFTVVLVCWLIGEAPGLGVVGASGDLAFAVVFAWWLATDNAPPARRAVPIDIARGTTRRRG